MLHPIDVKYTYEIGSRGPVANGTQIKRIHVTNLSVPTSSHKQDDHATAQREEVYFFLATKKKKPQPKRQDKEIDKRGQAFESVMS